MTPLAIMGGVNMARGLTIGQGIARQQIAALKAAGFRIVPEEPTEAMLAAGAEAVLRLEGQPRWLKCWRAMLAAGAAA